MLRLARSVLLVVACFAAGVAAGGGCQNRCYRDWSVSGVPQGTFQIPAEGLPPSLAGSDVTVRITRDALFMEVDSAEGWASAEYAFEHPNEEVRD